MPGISPILRLFARPEALRAKSIFSPLVLKKEVALDGKISYLGYEPNPLNSANNLFPVRDISYVTTSPDGPGGIE
jgi:hypothetical protein